MEGFILAAGLGTRLRPLTNDRPKALVEINGVTLLERTIRRLEAANVKHIVVNVHHFADKVIDFIKSHTWQAAIDISDERELLLDTGGGLKKAAALFSGRENVLVHNVDILSNLDLGWLREQHRPDALATLLVSDRKTQRYLLFREDGRLAGWTNLATGEVRSPYPDLDPSACRMLAFSGIHYMSCGIFQAFEALEMPERFPIMDFYLKACDRYPIYAAVPSNLHLLDVGKLDTLAQAERFCRDI